MKKDRLSTNHNVIALEENPLYLNQNASSNHFLSHRDKDSKSVAHIDGKNGITSVLLSVGDSANDFVKMKDGNIDMKRKNVRNAKELIFGKIDEPIVMNEDGISLSDNILRVRSRRVMRFSKSKIKYFSE